MSGSWCTHSVSLKVRSVAIMAVFLLVLAACASEDEAAEEGDADEPVTLTLLDHQEPRVELLKELLPQFEEEMSQQGRDITVELEEGPAPDDEFINALTLDFSAGNPPDVTSFGHANTTQFALSGYLLDLTPYTEQWPDWSEHFYEVLREQVTQPDGSVYAVPREAQILELFYRRDVLEENDISTDQPASWDDLLQRAEEATEAIGSPALLFPAGEAWGGGTFGEGFIHLMLGTDSPLYEDDKWVVRSSGLTAVFNYYEAMVQAEVLPVQPLLNPEPWVPTKYQAFPDGELAITTCGTWCWMFDWGPDGAAPIEDLVERVDTWQFPTEEGDETFVTGGSGWVWAIAADTEHPEAAWELVSWLSDGEAMARNATTVGSASPRDDLADVPPYSDHEFLIEAEEQLEIGRSFDAPEGLERIHQAVGEATEGIINGRMSGDEAAEVFASRAAELLGEEAVTEQ